MYVNINFDKCFFYFLNFQSMMFWLMMEDEDVWFVFNLDLDDVDGSVNWWKLNMCILCFIIVFVYVLLVNIDILCYMFMILNYMVYVSVFFFVGVYVGYVVYFQVY